MLETLYTDFTTKLLPKIQEGLVVTKEYFTDLFGRYIHFLIIVDTLSAILFFIGAIGMVFAMVKLAKWASKADEWDNPGSALGIVFGSLFAGVFIVLSINSVVNVVKDTYVPEVRVLEKLNLINQQ